MATKKGRTKFFSCSFFFVLVGSGIQDKHLGSANCTLVRKSRKYNTFAPLTGILEVQYLVYQHTVIPHGGDPVSTVTPP
jgi:hypothetical protein